VTRRYVTTPRPLSPSGPVKILGALAGGVVAIVTAAYHVVVGILVIVALVIIVALLVSRLFGCGERND